jgi:prepilin-type processing-associated H-X9-DG protein
MPKEAGFAMQEYPPPKPAQPLDYAHPGAFPWIWIGVACLGIVLLLFLMSILGRRGPTPVANRIKSSSNLRQIGQAIQLYANDSHGQYPDTFGDLLIEDIAPAIFVSPPSADDPATGPTTQAVAANLATPGHCSYIYLGKGLTTQTITPDIVVAYEPPAIWAGQGGNVLFGDGHVEFINMPAMNSILTQIKSGTWPVRYPPLPASAPATK